MYLIVDWSMPKSLISWIRLGAVKAIAKRPYSPSDRILATIITPIADIMEEATTPQNKLNPPFVEVLAKLSDLFMRIQTL